MLIYEIPSKIITNPLAIREFTQPFLDNALLDSCLFKIASSEDPRVESLKNELLFMVISKPYQNLFWPLLVKYKAKVLDSLPSFNKVEVLAGDIKTIDKVRR